MSHYGMSTLVWLLVIAGVVTGDEMVQRRLTQNDLLTAHLECSDCAGTASALHANLPLSTTAHEWRNGLPMRFAPRQQAAGRDGEAGEAGCYFAMDVSDTSIPCNDKNNTVYSPSASSGDAVQQVIRAFRPPCR
jgi:hypothetical protein